MTLPRWTIHLPGAPCLAVLLLATGNAWAQDDAAGPDCTHYYDRDDPALFRFVQTRDQVDYSRFEGMEIADIEYVVLPIFNEDDPDEDNWLFRTANALHIETLPSTVAEQMIIKPGEALTPETLRENERILRENDYLVDAMIVPQKICGNRIHLLAVVRDVWTLQFNASASRSGGENQASSGLTEENLFGTGQSISLGYFSNSERSGRTLSYENPQTLGEHATLSVDIEDNSDGSVEAVSLIRPFYQLDSRWSAGVVFEEQTRVETIESGGEILNEYRHDQLHHEAFVGWSAGLHDGVVHRWRLGMTRNDETFMPVEAPVSQPPPDRRFRYPWLSWESIENRFWTTSMISHSHRHEDILLGFHWFLRAGYASTRWNSTSNAVIYDFEHRYTASLGDHHLLRLGLGADGRHNTDTDLPESTFYNATATYYHFPDRKNRWFAEARYITGRNITEDEQLTSGGENLRGYPDDIQRGNRQWTFTLERRHFTDIHLFNLAYLGAAAYVDVGRTWDSTDSTTRDNPVLVNLGLGLRAIFSKFNVDEVLHLDVAVPLKERDKVDDYQIIVTTRVDF